MKLKHNKQHDARAASFKRIAKAIRTEIKQQLPYKVEPVFVSARALARIFDDEAKLLRSMR